MKPLSRFLAALASILGFYGCDGAHLAQLKPGISTAQEIRERLGARRAPNGPMPTAA
jgi:hypothetical protein